MSISRNQLFSLIVPLVLLTVGCGGGTQPFDKQGTRAKTQVLLRSFLGSGAMAFGNGPSFGGDFGSGGGMGTGESNASGAPARLDIYFRNLGSPGSRSHIAPGQEENKYFYYDEWLQLWVDVSYSDSCYRQDLFVDEKKTEPAGYIESILPQDWSSLPFISTSKYRFDKGTLAVAYGSYTLEALESGQYNSRYENHAADGSVDSGNSVYLPTGDSTYKADHLLADGSWVRMAGSTYSDGSGGSSMESSDGYKAVFVFYRDGSGTGKIQGNDPLLPAIIEWDSYGDVYIRYADGTTEHYNRWNWGYVDGDPVTVTTRTVKR